MSFKGLFPHKRAGAVWVTLLAVLLERIPRGSAPACSIHGDKRLQTAVCHRPALPVAFVLLGTGESRALFLALKAMWRDSGETARSVCPLCWGQVCLYVPLPREGVSPLCTLLVSGA